MAELKAEVNRNYDIFNRELCAEKDRLTAVEKDIIRLQGADVVLQNGITAQGTALTTAMGIIKTAMDGLAQRLETVETKVDKDIPACIDDTLKEDKQDQKDGENLKWNKIWVYVTIAGIIIASAVSFACGWLWH